MEKVGEELPPCGPALAVYPLYHTLLFPASLPGGVFTSFYREESEDREAK